MTYTSVGNGNFMKKDVWKGRNFTAKIFRHILKEDMKEKNIEKKSYGVFQDALFEKSSDGSYKPLDMAKEGMTTLKKHASQLTVICTDSSVEDVESLLKKNEIPYDKVIKLDEKVDFLVTGKDNAVHTYTWSGALDDIGFKLSREQQAEKESDQKKCDSSLERWFKAENDKCSCACN